MKAEVAQVDGAGLDYFLTKHIAEHLNTSMRNLAAFPALALFLGAIGAAVGTA